MKYVVNHNGSFVGQGSVLTDGSGHTLVVHPTGNPGVPAAEPRAGQINIGPFTQIVQIDDTIELVVIPDGGEPTFAMASFTIEQINDPNATLPEPLVEGDINRDNCVDKLDLIALSARWLANNCISPIYCFGSDIDEDGDINLDDFYYLSVNWQRCIESLHNRGFVVVSPGGPADGGDFGPATSGSQTSGMQEAINFAVASGKDVYYIGGSAPFAFQNPVVYFLHGTIHFPPARNFTFTGGDCVINYNLSTGDIVTFDSQLNGTFRFPLLVGPGIGNTTTILKLNPLSPGPDGQVGIFNSRFDAFALVGGGNVFGENIEGRGNALRIDASAGPVAHNEIIVLETIACQKGIFLEAGDIYGNYIECLFNHINNDHLFVQADWNNYIKNFITSGNVGGQTYGARLSGGHDNIYDLNITSAFEPGNKLILSDNARDNLIYTRSISPEHITNTANTPTNRLVPLNQFALQITTPAVPGSGVPITNDIGYTVVVTITSSGTVSQWMLTDGNGLSRAVTAPLYAGQTIYFEPGETLQFNYSVAPQWLWRARQ